MDDNNMNVNGDYRQDNNCMNTGSPDNGSSANQGPYQNQNQYQNQDPYQNQNQYQNQSPYQYQYQNQYQQYQPYAGGQQYGDGGIDLEEPVSVGEWVLSFLLLMVPCVNIIMVFVWAFSHTEKKSKSNFFKAYLILIAVLLGLWILIALVIVMTGYSLIQ